MPNCKYTWLKVEITAIIRENITTKMFYCSIKKGETIFQQGDSATCFFVIGKIVTLLSIHHFLTSKGKNGGHY